jgi:hypothetical protein
MEDGDLAECPEGWITLICPGCPEQIWADPTDCEGWICMDCGLKLVPIHAFDGNHRRVH